MRILKNLLAVHLKSFLRLFISILLLFLPATSKAGAWLNRPGESTLINSIYYFHFNKFVTTNGHVQDRPDFMKFEYKPYYEYGAK